MGTNSLHTATATAILPSVNVPEYVLTPGYTTQYPGAVIRTDDFSTDTGGWIAGPTSRVTRATVPAFGRPGLVIDRLSTAGTASATREFTGLLVGRKYHVAMRAALPSPANGRSLVLPSTSGAVAAESGAGWDGIALNYSTIFVATATTQTITLAVNGVPAGGAGVYTVGMYVRDVTLTLRATSVFTPPVMQPPSTVAGRTVTLSVKSSSVTLDDAYSPYAKATLVCYAPSIETLEALDPRKSIRVNVTLTQSWGDGSDNWNSFGYRAPFTRTFDLALRERDVNKKTGEMTLELWGDEALLIDYAHVATAPDTTPVGHQASLRAVANYALGKIGASLAAGDDTHVTVSQSPNLLRNPSGRRGATGYVPQNGNMGQDAGVDTYVQANGNYPQGVVGLSLQQLVVGTDIEANTTYTLSAGLLGVNGASKALLYALGSVVGGGASSPPSATGGPFVRRSVTFTTGATGNVGIYILNSGAIATGGLVAFQDAQLERGSVTTPYFDGATPADAKYTYAWTGTADNSTSTRTLVTPRSEQLLDWMPGVSAWDFLAPIVQATGYRLWCDEARVWRLAKAWNTQTQINVSPDTGLTSGVDRITRNEGWWDSVVIEYRWTDRTGRRQTAWDIAGVPGNNTDTTVYTDTPYPGPGAAASVLRRADGRGRIISPESINNYLATPGMVLQVSLPDSPVQTGMLSNVTWNQPENVMQVGSRGLTDTPANAWVNAVGSWAAATGTWVAATGTN